MNRKKTILMGAGVFTILHVAVVLCAEPIVTVGNFSQANTGEMIPLHWESLTFKKIKAHTIYKIVEDQGRTVVKAYSLASASGLIRKISIDVKQYPIIQWQWKITQINEKSDVTQKAGDDYPARIYVAFIYDPDKAGFWEKTKFETARMVYGQYPPATVVTYVWANRAPKETRVPNPYVDRVMMIAVQSGEEKAGTWVTEERNIYQDYVDSFGHPPLLTSGVAIMTDTDNTGETSTAFYGDIFFKSTSGDPIQ
ncbi:DUF3047 domain-containing protein [uncultured Desulfobacter sp.]|uniref:DUF3047 domain-containing protein n=1 Tax=uncultured Desulfobacter sp. TaxID=240139 RepID=UPI0029F5BFAF|nr:DUF3047 domain-containing protein [uncultured Desulfobacter sp.]